jgi:hypothetical protein
VSFMGQSRSRRKPGRENAASAARRLSGCYDPSTSDRIYDDDESEFLMAIKAYQERTGNRFPRWSIVLGILKSLGYRKQPTDATNPRQ